MINNLIYLTVTIDTECDKDSNWEIQYPMRFTSVTNGVPEILTPLFETYQIKPTYLLSPEVIYDDDAVSVLRSVRNCELGAHLHGEFIEPQANPSATRTHTPQLLYDQSIEQQKLQNLTTVFKERFGYLPTSFRAGRFGLSHHTLDILESLGFLVDSSVTPFWTHFFEGRATRNYWGSPLFPYKPASQDPRRHGNLNLLEVPVTIYNSMFGNWPKAILRLLNNNTRIHKRVLRRLGYKVPKTLWLRPQRSTPEELIDTAKQVIQLQRNKPFAVLNMMYHSVEIIPGASPYAANDIEVEAIVEGQRKLFQFLESNYQIKPVGLSELYDVYHQSI